MRTPALLLVLGLSGCAGPITNALFEEDADFLAALPSADRHTVHWVEPGGERTLWSLAPRGEPDLAAWTGEVAVAWNDAALAVLDLVDLVRQQPPSARAEEGRAWGPWRLDSGAWLRVDMERSGLGLYDWTFSFGDAEEGPWVEGIGGEHWAGETVAAGDGAFEAHVGTVAGFLDVDRDGEISVDYDNREGIDLDILVEGYVDPSLSAPLDATYGYVEDAIGNADFEWASAQDVDGGGGLEDLVVRARWTAAGAGRADARATGGDLGDLTVTLSQCWDETGARVYGWDDAGLFPPLGEESDCAFRSALPPDGAEEEDAG